MKCHVANFATFVSKTLIFSSQKMDDFNSKLAQYCSNKYLNWPSPVFGQFQNGCKKVVIEPHVVQFLSEIILVFSNWTCAARSFNFEITRMISAQIALHSVQLPLFISLVFSEVASDYLFMGQNFLLWGKSNMLAIMHFCRKPFQCSASIKEL